MTKKQAMLKLLAALVGHEVDHSWKTLAKVKEAEESMREAGCSLTQFAKVQEDAKGFYLFGGKKK